MHSMRVLAVDQDAGRASDRQLYRALAREQHMDLSLLAPEIWRGGLEDVTFEPESPGSLTVDPTPTRFSGKSHRALYSAMLRSVRKIKPDLLFLNAEPESFASAQAALIVSRFSPGTRFVFMSWRNQDYTGSGFPYKLGFLNSLCEKLVLRRAAGCVARTERARELIQGKGFKSVAVIPPAVDTILFHQTEGLSERAELGVHGFCIGYVGRLSQEKGLDLLMRSTVLMPAGFYLLIVGEGEEKKPLQKLAAELGVHERILWAGAVAHDGMPSYLNAMDALVLPSRTGETWKEQFGRVLVEAMSCGVPVVGSISGEIPAVIGNAGLLFDEGNHHALAAAITRLRDDNDLRGELTRRGKTRVREHFSVEAVIPQYVRFFSSLVR